MADAGADQRFPAGRRILPAAQRTQGGRHELPHEEKRGGDGDDEEEQRGNRRREDEAAVGVITQQPGGSQVRRLLAQRQQMVAETQRRLPGQLRQKHGEQRRVAKGVGTDIAADATEKAQRIVARLRAQAPITMAGDADGVAVNPDAQRRGTAVEEQAQDKGGDDDQRQQGESDRVP